MVPSFCVTGRQLTAVGIACVHAGIPFAIDKGDFVAFVGQCIGRVVPLIPAPRTAIFICLLRDYTRTCDVHLPLCHGT